MKRILAMLASSAALVGLFACVAAAAPPQGPVPSGFVQLATVTSGTTYADTACPDSGTCIYYVTAFNAQGESQAVGPVVGAVPGSGVHTVVLKWVAPTAGPTPSGYHVWVAETCFPPSGLIATVN